MTWFEYMVSFIVGIVGLLCLYLWVAVVYKAIVSDRPITFEGVMGSIGVLAILALCLTFFATYIYIRCNLKGVAKALYGEHNIWSLGLDSFSVFHVSVFGHALTRVTMQGSLKMQNRFIASRKFFKRDIPPDLILSFNDNAKKLVELKKNYPWLLRLDYLFLIAGLIFGACPILMLLTSK